MITKLLALRCPTNLRQIRRSAFLAAMIIGLGMVGGISARAQTPEPAAASKPLDQTFPDKVGSYARTAAKKNTAGITGDATDAAEAKYSSGSGEITWTATAFATPEKAIAMLQSTIETLTKEGAKVATNIKNAEGKIRFAVLETKQGPQYCWVNKKEKTLLYVVTGKAPDVSKFVELQTTW